MNTRVCRGIWATILGVVAILPGCAADPRRPVVTPRPNRLGNLFAPRATRDAGKVRIRMGNPIAVESAESTDPSDPASP